MDNKNVKYHLGVDLGVGSLSFTIRKEYLEKGKVVKNEILPPYVETYSVDSAEYRRGKRSSSRVTKRRWTRVQSLCKLFDITHSELVKFQISDQKNHAPYLKYESLKNDKQLSKIELLSCLVHYAKYRNYSNLFDTLPAESEDGKEDKKTSEYKGCIKEGDRFIKEYKYPTIAWFEDDFFVKQNKQRNWKNTRFMGREPNIYWALVKKYETEKKVWKEFDKEENNLTNLEKTALEKLCKEGSRADNLKKEVGVFGSGSNLQVLFERTHWKNEALELLRINNKSLPCNKDKIIKVIYSQRFAETGPGKGSSLEEVKAYKNDTENHKNMSYREKNASFNHTAFTEKIGNCPYYITNERASKLHPLNVSFVVINELIKIKNDLLKALKLIDPSSNANNVLDILREIHSDFIRVDEPAKTVGKNFLKKYDWFQALEKNYKKSNEYESLIDWFVDKGVKSNLNNNIKRVTALANKLKDIHNKYDINFDQDDYELLVTTLYNHFTPVLREEKLKASFSFLNKKPDILKELMKVNASGTAHFSIEALIDQIEIFETCDSLEELYDYRIKMQKESEEKLKFDIEKPLNRLEERTNPVVFSAISRIKKHIEKLVVKKGFYFDNINIEIGNELSLSEKARSAIYSAQINRRDQKIKVKERIKELNQRVNTTNINRYICWVQQNKQCLYTGEEINENDIFSDKYELDHIIPRSILPIDSLENRALVQEAENRKKGDSTPLGYIGVENRKAYLSRIERIKKKWYAKNKLTKIDERARADDLYFVNQQKLKFLTCKEEDKEEIARGFLTRDLNNNKYLSKSIVSYLHACIRTDRNKDKNEKWHFHKNDTNFTKVNSVSGQITSSLRKELFKDTIWGGEKLRDVTDWHHGIDSICLSLCSSTESKNNNHYLLKVKTLCSLNRKSSIEEKKELWSKIRHSIYKTNEKIIERNGIYAKRGEKKRIALINYKSWDIDGLLKSLSGRDSIDLEKILNFDRSTALKQIPIELEVKGDVNPEDIQKTKLNETIFLKNYKCDSKVFNNVNFKNNKKIPTKFINSENMLSKKNVDKLTKGKAKWKKIIVKDGRVVEVDAKDNETAFHCSLTGTKILRKVQVEDGFITKSYMAIGVIDRNLLGKNPKTGKFEHLKAITAFQSQQAIKQKNKCSKKVTSYFTYLIQEFVKQDYKEFIYIQNGDTIILNKEEEVFLFKVNQVKNGKVYGNYPGYKQGNFKYFDNKDGYINITNIKKISCTNNSYYSNII